MQNLKQITIILEHKGDGLDSSFHGNSSSLSNTYLHGCAYIFHLEPFLLIILNGLVRSAKIEKKKKRLWSMLFGEIKKNLIS